MIKELDKIKKYYGENMSHLCRKLFPTILETKGLLFDLISNSFAPNKFLYEDLVKYSQIINFRDYINDLVFEEQEEIETNKSVEELLEEAGYELFECHTEEEILSFQKYYEEEEKLCTFKEINERLRDNYVFFIVKKNVDSIKREDYDNPLREDTYGTSVMSIQIDKICDTVSIKNRYNHSVFNPDATYENNLDNIINGLKKAFENKLGIEINHHRNKGYFNFIGYTISSDGKYYKYNYEINNIYYGPNNVIIDNYKPVTEYQQNERYIVFDYFIIDLENKTIELYDKRINDSFSKIHENISKIEIKKERDKKYISITINNEVIEIVLDKQNRMISYKNNSVTIISNNFLGMQKYLKILEMDNLEIVGNNFIATDQELEEMFLSNLKFIGNNFMVENRKMKIVNLPNAISTGHDFMARNRIVKEVNMPKLENFERGYLRESDRIERILKREEKNKYILYLRPYQ